MELILQWREFFVSFYEGENNGKGKKFLLSIAIIFEGMKFCFFGFIFLLISPFTLYDYIHNSSFFSSQRKLSSFYYSEQHCRLNFIERRERKRMKIFFFWKNFFNDTNWDEEMNLTWLDPKYIYILLLENVFNFNDEQFLFYFFGKTIVKLQVNFMSLFY